jgi:hypothetical protein
MLGAMLGAAEGCLTTPESQFKIAPIRIDHGLPCDFAARSIFAMMAGHERYRLWNVAPPELVNADGRDVQAYREAIWLLVDGFARETGVSSYRWWIDHTPGNTDSFPQLRLLFPDARFIHIVRDGRAIAASFLALDWGPKDMISAAYSWSKRVAEGLVAEFLCPELVLRVYYEDLVKEPEATLRRICSFLEVDFCAAMVEGKGFVVPQYSRPQHKLVGQQPDPSRIDEWTRRLSRRQIEVFECCAGARLRQMGYKLLNPRPRRPAKLVAKAARFLGETRRRMLAAGRTARRADGIR